MLKKIALLLFVSGLTFVATAQKNKFITTSGTHLIAPGGKQFLMKGTNLGNWLVPEGYMFKFKHTSSPRLIQEMLLQLSGPDEANLFWKKYLENYVTKEDIHYLASIGMNSIRIPFHYKLFTDEEYMGGHGIARGFAIMDKLISWCR